MSGSGAASGAELRTTIGTCFEKCRWASCSKAVRPAACVQVLNCIDYLHKFGYSKEQVGSCHHDVSGIASVANIAKHDLCGHPCMYIVHDVAEHPAHEMWSAIARGVMVAHAFWL